MSNENKQPDERAALMCERLRSMSLGTANEAADLIADLERDRNSWRALAESAKRDLAARATAPQATVKGEERVTGDGYLILEVKGLQDLDTALDRADSKGHLPDDIRSAWEGLDWRATAPQAAGDERAALIAERDAAVMSTHRQAFCIQQCAAHIGPETSATIDGLPRAVKRVVEELNMARAAVPQASTLTDEQIAVLSRLRDVLASGHAYNGIGNDNAVIYADALRALLLTAQGGGQ